MIDPALPPAACGNPVSPYLRRPARSLREVCEATGRYGAGEHCPVCPLRSFCSDNMRRHQRAAAQLIGSER